MIGNKYMRSTCLRNLPYRVLQIQVLVELSLFERHDLEQTLHGNFPENS